MTHQGPESTVTAPPGPVVLSVDAMGSDAGPAMVVAGLARFLKTDPDVRVLLHGPKDELTRLVARRKLEAHVEIVDAEGTVSMHDKPSQVMRHGKGTSMWSALESVRERQASVCVSCGNTGALMALSMLRLRKVEGVNRPAIAGLWPSRNPSGYNILLDAGADIRADQDDLLTYALMGASYARNGLGIERPRVGLLNVGVEEHKGRAELKVAQELIAKAAPRAEFDFVGFVEGSEMASERVDVIVTDGFTGNVALKTGEGTAQLLGGFMREAFMKTPLSRIAALLAYTSIRRLRKRMDPRRANGGVFLGLNGTVVKSHGSADATAMEAALELAAKLARSGFADRLAARVATATALAQDGNEAGEAAPAGAAASKADK
ncbi:phosphate acyltransferase PlsX [Pseudoroseicyclus sp. CXY001]|uniref:phosphate acyltransferase PlsX n=1 Tax=Pseudoroseicyclus sp. CXY001 TaxID=3242492 RepID=UPI00358DB3E8